MVNYDQLNVVNIICISLYASARDLVPYVCMQVSLLYMCKFEADYIYTSVSYAGRLRIKYTSK